MKMAARVNAPECDVKEGNRGEGKVEGKEEERGALYEERTGTRKIQQGERVSKGWARRMKMRDPPSPRIPVREIPQLSAAAVCRLVALPPGHHHVAELRREIIRRHRTRRARVGPSPGAQWCT